ncbi:MAG: peptidoglycan-binding protein [Clostridia bacterium]
MIQLDAQLTPLVKVAGNTLIVYDNADPNAPVFVRADDVTMGEAVTTGEAETADDAETTDQAETADDAETTGQAETADDATLERGARGEKVEALQRVLRTLGYLSGSADGIYGSATVNAVSLLQSDMGLSPTGRADAAFQQTVLEGDPPKYERYVRLSRGDSGPRVRELQARLYELCYTKFPADGQYGSDTASAVSRFQRQHGDREHGDEITASLLKRLYRTSTATCTQYFKLTRGDSAPAVHRLNRRLKKLGYLSGSVGSSYTKRTTEAVRAFQGVAKLKSTGIADTKTQHALFRHNAPTPSPTPEPGPHDQAVSNSVIKTMRLWMQKHFGDKYTKKGAVEQLQLMLETLGYLSSSEVTGVYNRTTKAAVKEFQQDNGLTANGNANKQTLKAMMSK